MRRPSAGPWRALGRLPLRVWYWTSARAVAALCGALSGALAWELWLTPAGMLGGPALAGLLGARLARPLWGRLDAWAREGEEPGASPGASPGERMGPGARARERARPSASTPPGSGRDGEILRPRVRWEAPGSTRRKFQVLQATVQETLSRR